MGGRAYSGSGKIKEVVKTPQGGMIAYYDVYTSPGNSGSGVRFKDLVNGKLINVGVHVAFSRSKKLNVCTVYTPELDKWIDETLEKQEFKKYRV